MSESMKWTSFHTMATPGTTLAVPAPAPSLSTTSLVSTDVAPSLDHVNFPKAKPSLYDKREFEPNYHYLSPLANSLTTHLFALSAPLVMRCWVFFDVCCICHEASSTLTEKCVKPAARGLDLLVSHSRSPPFFPANIFWFEGDIVTVADMPIAVENCLIVIVRPPYWYLFVNGHNLTTCPGLKIFEATSSKGPKLVFIPPTCEIIGLVGYYLLVEPISDGHVMFGGTSAPTPAPKGKAENQTSDWAPDFRFLAVALPPAHTRNLV
ncbi:hypothetical protein BDZ97DRAFT_1758310 [Flammula alnicola]|nr:hypothetical protein BDZ97DRAFT_1758310 [Flammula alnicola]